MGPLRITTASVCAGTLLVGGLVPVAAASAVAPGSASLGSTPDKSSLQVEELSPVAALRSAQAADDSQAQPAVPARTLTNTASAPSDSLTVVEEDANGDLRVSEVTAQNPNRTARALNAAPKTVASPAKTRSILNAPRSDGSARDLQWQLNHVRAEDAWRTSSGARITVAVIDTGVDAAHPDLAGRVLPGYDAIRRRAGGNVDPNGHGTHVAGAIVGHGSVAGVAPDARVLPVRVMDRSGFGSTADIAAGIVWAVNNGADIINLSIGSTAPDRAEKKVIQWAFTRGVLVVAAAGNEGNRKPVYPAAYRDAKRNARVGRDPVLGVGAVHRSGAYASFSQRGRFVDVVAPGVRLLSTAPRSAGSYGWDSGTSMAAPVAAGVAAVAMSHWKATGRPGSAKTRSAAISSALRSSARDLGPTGTDKRFGSGEVDAAAALAALGGPATSRMSTGGMSTNARLIGGARGRAILGFTAPAGADVRVRLASRLGGSGAPGADSDSDGQYVWAGNGGREVQLSIAGLSDARSYTATIFSTLRGVTSRTVTGLRPVQLRVWCPRKMNVSRRSKLKVATILPTEFGIPGGAITVTFTSGSDRRITRVVPSGDGKAVVPVPPMRGKVRFDVTVDAADGNWPTTSTGHRVRLRR
ncbi:MAG: S8 family serine peptidase [Actinobacteria bacterium]|nr:S8 family serine peptidase [Actinomycetota bacterium]